MMGTPAFKTNNAFNSTMMALFLTVIVSKKNKPTRATAGAPAGIWPVVRTYNAEEWGGGGDYNLTVIIQSKQWIYNIYNLFIIYITLFIIGIT